MNQELTQRTGQSLQKKKLWKFTPTSLQTAFDNTGFPKDKIAFIAEVINETIKDMGPQRATVELEKIIPQVAIEYGVTEPIPSNVLSEAVRLVYTRHSDLNIREIREAYREFTSGTLFNDKNDAETWKGMFSAKQLGRILSAYKIQKRKIAAELKKAIEEEERNQNAAEMHEQKRKIFERKFREEIQIGQKTFSSWKFVPSYWYRYLEGKKVIQFEEGEKRRFWIHAFDLFKAEAAAEELVFNPIELEILRDGYHRDFTFEEMKKVSQSKIDAAELKIINISKKLVVFKKIIQNKDFNFELL